MADYDVSSTCTVIVPTPMTRNRSMTLTSHDNSVDRSIKMEQSEIEDSFDGRRTSNRNSTPDIDNHIRTHQTNQSSSSTLVSDLSVQPDEIIIPNHHHSTSSESHHTKNLSSDSFNSPVDRSDREEIIQDHQRKRISLRRLKYNSLEPLKSIYRTAARSFLHNDHLSVWISLSEGLDKVSNLLSLSDGSFDLDQRPWWTNESSDGATISLCFSQDPIQSIEHRLDQELYELARKLNILRITFIASIYSPQAIQTIKSLILHQSLNEHRQHMDSLLKLLALHPDSLITDLWTLAFNHRSGPDCSGQTTIDPRWIIHIHPSIVTALALASIKLSAPQAGKYICESWLSSLSVEVLDFLEDLMSNEDHSIINSTTGTSDSIVILDQSTESPAKRAGSNVRYNYTRLIEVYAVHILGSVDEWSFAHDFLKAQSRESGGILPIETVQNVINALEATQLQQSQTEQLLRLKQERLQKERYEQDLRSLRSANPNQISNPHHHHQSSHPRSGSSYRAARPTSRTRESRTNLKANDDLISSDQGSKTGIDPSTRSSRLAVSKTGHEPNGSSSTGLKEYIEQDSNSGVRSRGFSSLRDHLSRYLLHPIQRSRPVDSTRRPTGWFRYFTRSLISNHHRLTTVAVLVMMMSITKIIRRLMGYKRRNKIWINPIWLLGRLIEWVMKKFGETARMGTRITYL